MFIRIKKLKGKEYAYLVENTWTDKGPRQKTKKYLGRCFSLDKIENKSFAEYFNVDIEDFIYSNNFKKTLSMLFELELINHGFEKLKKDDLIAYPKQFKVKNSLGKEVVLKINEGFLCSYNIKKILNFKFKDEEEDAYKFAETFLIAGFNVEKEVFIEIFRKLTNK